MPTSIKSYLCNVCPPWKFTHTCFHLKMNVCFDFFSSSLFIVRYNASDITVRLGEFDRSNFEGTERDFEIDSITIHHRYDPTKYVGHLGHKQYPSMDHDIALLKITPQQTNEVGLTNGDIQPIDLPKGTENFSKGSRCYIVGWGYTRKLKLYLRQLLKKIILFVCTILLFFH